MFNRSPPPSRPAIPFGQRVYAIGDVHGEAGLLRRVLRLIEEDNAARREATVTLVFLGDIVDRGPDAAALLQTFARMNVDHVVMLKGNHEEALIQAYHGDDEVLDQWMPFGAMATLTGFGVTLKEIDSTNNLFATALRRRIDPDLIAWLEQLPSAWDCGGYYFAHAGVRPGVELAEQDEADLRWIREPFLSSRKDHGKVVVHGHTVEPGMPKLGGNRIGIDTGAYEHGVLTALGLEGERQWLLQATGKENRDGAFPEPANDRIPMPDLAALITAIVTPAPPAPDAPLLLENIHRPARAKRRLGKRGVAVAGFALVLASLGGAFALRSTIWPRSPDDVSVAVPEFRAPAPAPTLLPAAPTVDRPAPRRLVTRPKADEGSPRLSGQALEKALEEDREKTRKLNQDEMSRQGTHSDDR